MAPEFKDSLPTPTEEPAPSLSQQVELPSSGAERWSRLGGGTDLVHAFTSKRSTGSGPDGDGSLRLSVPPGLSHDGAYPHLCPDESTETRPLVLPQPGDTLDGFQIVGELGRGAFARVYLARQTSLGNRLVALKVSRAEGDEPQMLARLQHTHIVPIHSVHDDPRTGLRLICMPYLGGANLAQVLEAAGASLPEEVRGRSLIEALDLVSQRLQTMSGADPSVFSLAPAPFSRRTLSLFPRSGVAPERPVSIGKLQSISKLQALWARISARRKTHPAPLAVSDESELGQPARQFLRAASSIQAAVWIVARLAEGLDHAHARGLLHRDLKPSNILIAGDGTPMLLDFNLATSCRPDHLDEGARAMLGGTLPYMAPEHLDAFHPNGTTPAEAVDERSDLYALGLILFEMIAGRSPFPEPPPGLPLLDVLSLMITQRQTVPSLRAACPGVPWSLDALVAQCLAPDPNRRYARARDLAEDLRRFLDDLPLKHAPEPSLRERLAKWTRRHPRICSATSTGVVAMVLLLALGVVLGLVLSNFQTVSARLKLKMFQSGFDECQFLLNTASGPVEHLGQGVQLAQQTLDLPGIDRQGTWRHDFWVSRLTPDEQLRMREQASELILLEARARTYLAVRYGSEADQKQALEWAVTWLDRAERLDPHPPAALFEDRARYLAALGLSGRARRDETRAARTPPATARDFVLLGTSHLMRRTFDRAEAALLRAVTLEPRRFWAWFTLGLCHFEQGRFLEAAGDFGTCTALEPRFAWPHLNRGLALAHAGRLNEARLAYDRALEVDPRSVEALVNRALTCLELDDLGGAERDLNRTLALGRRDPAVLATLGELLARRGRRAEAERLYADLLKANPEDAVLRVARGIFRLNDDRAGARRDFEHVLTRDPRYARAHYGLARLEWPGNPRAALAHVNEALRADPNLIDALQFRALLRARLGVLSAIDDVEHLIRTPTPHRLYNAACALAILSRTSPEHRLDARALALLGRALDAGFPPEHAATDPDWSAFRDRPEFQELIRKAKP